VFLLLALSQACSAFRTLGLNPDMITCPVLAMMVDGGTLHPDEHGSITLDDMHDGMIETGADDYTANYFAIGVIQYDAANKETQLHRDRCYPGSACFRAKLAAGGVVTNETERYLNIYTMNGVETVEHGFSTGIRGGWTNPPDFLLNGGCNGTFPCEEQYSIFAEPCADSAGRFYRENILCMICLAQEKGDRGGEWSFNPFGKKRGWQMSVAMLSMLAGYGRLPSPTADPYGPETHFTTADMRRMFMEGKNPEGWAPRNWSNASMIKDLTETQVPCEDEYGDTAPWWGDTECPSNTRVPCSPIFGSLYECGCPAGSTCINDFCVCGRGANGISMCSDRLGRCVEREDKCSYFGEKCHKIVADNPAAPW